MDVDDVAANDKTRLDGKESEGVFCICRHRVKEDSGGSPNDDDQTDEQDDDDDDEDEEDLMIECDACNDWLHGKCVSITHSQAVDIETYICPRCVAPNKAIVCK